jgi:hypothetical protein
MHELGPRKFIRSTAVAGDIKTYDAGNFFMCTTDEADTSMIGKLWVNYEVELYNQQLEPTAAPVPARGSYYSTINNEAMVTGVAEAVPFTTAVADPLGWGTATAGVWATPPAGVYDIEAEVQIADTAAEAAGLTTRIEFLVGGSSMAPVRVSDESGVTAGAETRQCNLRSFVVLDGLSSFQVRATATGAAGALSMPAARSRLAITLI